MERLAREEHSSILRTVVKYGSKKSYNIGPWLSAWPLVDPMRHRRTMMARVGTKTWLIAPAIFGKLILKIVKK
jgi:hypothetical protein